ncbi:MAG: hypothetical protein M0P57_01055 [Syntrophales bacterium]|nr:hypothetical protein [Syntrophales bacterium]
MTNEEIRTHCRLDEKSKQLIEMAVDTLGISARAYTKIIKVARTIADLESEESIESHHVSEAIQYRNLDRIAI